MTADVSIPVTDDHPVAMALNDPAIRARLECAARAFLGRQAIRLSATERTAEAQVIVQEAVARAWKLRDRYDSSGNVVNWLVGFVRNVARELAKKRGRETSPPSPGSPRLEELVIDPSRPVEQVLADQQLATHLLEQLSSTDKAIVRMQYEEGLTCAEIGQRIGVAENAVRVRVYRALVKLKRLCGVAGEGQP